MILWLLVRGPEEPGFDAEPGPVGVETTVPEEDVAPLPEIPSELPGPWRREAEQQILDATNAERAERGLAPLALDPLLRRSARAHSLDMLERGFFDHGNPDGESPGDRVSATHRRLVGLSGENIWTGSGYGTSAAGELTRVIVGGWMSSPGHRANILKPEFTHLGVGVAAVGREVRATQVFATAHGMIARPVPATVSRGARLELGRVPGPRGAAVKFDLWSPRRQVKVAGPFELPGATIDAAPGRYQLRFYFSDGPRRYVIYFGPSIEVR